MYTLNAERHINALADIVWDVISDVERYAEYAPNLSHVHKTSDGLTPARRCYDNQGRGWNEACVLWEDRKQYAYLIDTSDYPYPFAHMKGTWGMDDTPEGVRVWMRFEYAPDKPWVLGWLVHRRVQQVFGPIVAELLDNREAEIDRRTREAARP
ncbi:MAG: SRPBCC family protein [Chloroflexi bacterium]|nr:SRPBCC family protein [Chloroflexota bacterium]